MSINYLMFTASDFDLNRTVASIPGIRVKGNQFFLSDLCFSLSPKRDGYLSTAPSLVGFSPSQIMSCSLCDGTSETYENQLSNLLFLAQLILSVDKADFALTFEWDMVMLRRLSGKVVINVELDSPLIDRISGILNPVSWELAKC